MKSREENLTYGPGTTIIIYNIYNPVIISNDMTKEITGLPYTAILPARIMYVL